VTAEAGPPLGVLVLAYGAGREHDALLDSLAAEGVAAASILVVHNEATPGEAAPPVPAGVELARTGANLGYAGGMNFGLDLLLPRGYESILLLTHDARLRPGALAALRGARERSPRFGILGPALLLTGTETPFSFGGVTDREGANAHLKEAPPTSDGIAACDWVDGGSMLIGREVLERVGDFDARYWGYCEEADLCLRARRAGFAVGVVVAAQADQAPGAAKRPGAWAYLTTRNGIEYAERAVGARGLVAITARSALIVAINLARVALRRTGLREGSPAEPWALAVGTARGAVDRFRGRWGPPPADLPGLGDLGNA
jgi:N-acetylglucosaminyl-diphospho-decaprenol L-rhamnosyltransferase